MKILKIWAENVRGISKLTEIELSPLGVTIISAPNEFGKSTLAEVPRHLIKTIFSSTAAPIKSLQPYNRPDAAVTMGMRFEIDGKIYEIIKNFVKNSSALLKHIQPLGKDLTNDEAEEKLAQILEPFDNELFNLVYMKQGHSSAAIGSSSSVLKGNTTLQSFVDEASSREADLSSTNLVAKVQKEYGTWWTGKGKPATGVDSNGRRLADATAAVSRLQNELDSVKSTQVSRQAELADLTKKAASSANAQALYETQLRIAELDKAQLNLEKLQALTKSLEGRDSLEDYLDTWTVDKHTVLKETQFSFLKAQAASVVTVRALRAFSLQANGEAREIDKDQTVEIPQLPNSSIQIDDIAVVQFGNDDDTSEENFEVLRESLLHSETLNEIGINSLIESENIFAFKTLRDQKSDFESEFGTESTLAETINAIRAEQASNKDLWAEARASNPIVFSDITAGSEEQGRLKQLSENIANENFPDQILRIENDLDEAKKEETRLKIDADSIKLLLETLERNRDASRNEISKALEGVLQRHIEGVFGPSAKVALHEDLSFDVLNRDETNVDTSALSVGAGEQLALAFRLGVAEVARSKCEIPIILDDEFAHTDKTRLDRIASHLKTLGDQQIVLFTHQPEKLAKISNNQIPLG